MPIQNAFEYSGNDEDGQWWAQPKRAYRSFGPFKIVSTLMAAVAVGIVAFGLSCAVMFVADLAEEHPTRARVILRALIITNIAVHTSIFLIDQLSWWRSLLSLVVNTLYLRIMRSFPFVPSLDDTMMVVTVGAVFLESALWYWYCITLMYYTSILNILGFFVLIWLVPVGLLSSCVVEEEQLPGGGGLHSGGGASGLPGASAGGRRKRTILNRLSDLIYKSQAR